MSTSKQHRVWIRIVVGVVAAAVVSSAVGSSSPWKAGLECGLGGAGVGYLACKLTGKSSKECKKVALGAGAAGALACSLYAKRLDNRRKELEGKEQDLDAQIRFMQGLNADTRQLNADLAERVSSMTAETDALVAQITQQQVSQEQLVQERESRDEALKTSRDEVAQGQKALEEAKTRRAQQASESAALDGAIKEQEQLLASAERQVKLLAEQRARV